MVLHDFWIFFIWSTVAGLAVVGIYQLLLLILRARGVFVTRRKFGLTMIFDSEDADGTPIRLLNVNGTFQSVSYIAPELRFELCVHYHRMMAKVIQQVAPEGHVIVMGGGGFSLPKYLATHMKGAIIDAIEIDPKIVLLAREHFFLDEALATASSDLRVIEDDAWKVLQNANAGNINVLVNEVFAGRKSLGSLGTTAGTWSKKSLHLAEYIWPMFAVRLRDAALRYFPKLRACLHVSLRTLRMYPSGPILPKHQVTTS